MEARRRTFKQRSKRYMPLELWPSKEAFIMRLIYATRLSFLDHWGCDLSVSHLASVATRESLSFSTAISINWMKIWCGKRYFTALDMRPCQWITVDGQFEPRFVCQWEFFFGISNVRTHRRGDKKKGSCSYSLNNSDFRPAIVLPQLFLGL